MRPAAWISLLLLPACAGCVRTPPLPTQPMPYLQVVPARGCARRTQFTITTSGGPYERQQLSSDIPTVPPVQETLERIPSTQQVQVTGHTNFTLRATLNGMVQSAMATVDPFLETESGSFPVTLSGVEFCHYLGQVEGQKIYRENEFGPEVMVTHLLNQWSTTIHVDRPGDIAHPNYLSIDIPPHGSVDIPRQPILGSWFLRRDLAPGEQCPGRLTPTELTATIVCN